MQNYLLIKKIHITRRWVKINDDSRVTYPNADIKFKTTMLKSDLCDYADA